MVSECCKIMNKIHMIYMYREFAFCISFDGIKLEWVLERRLSCLTCASSVCAPVST